MTSQYTMESHGSGVKGVGGCEAGQKGTGSGKVGFQRKGDGGKSQWRSTSAMVELWDHENLKHEMGPFFC